MPLGIRDEATKTRQNDNKSIITLTGGSTGPMLPAQTTHNMEPFQNLANTPKVSHSGRSYYHTGIHLNSSFHGLLSQVIVYSSPEALDTSRSSQGICRSQFREQKNEHMTYKTQERVVSHGENHGIRGKTGWTAFKTQETVKSRHPTSRRGWIDDESSSKMTQV
jgi:hypothetical protein